MKMLLGLISAQLNNAASVKGLFGLTFDCGSPGRLCR